MIIKFKGSIPLESNKLAYCLRSTVAAIVQKETYFFYNCSKRDLLSSEVGYCHRIWKNIVRSKKRAVSILSP